MFGTVGWTNGTLPPGQFVTVAAVARYLGRSRSEIRRQIKHKALRAVLVSPPQYLIIKDSVREYLRDLRMMFGNTPSAPPPPPPPPTDNAAEVQAASAATRASARKRRGLSASILAGEQKTPDLVASEQERKATLG